MKKRIAFLFAVIILVISAFVLSCSNDDGGGTAECKKPSAPSVIAVPLSSSGIRISWTPVESASRYNIYRAVTSDGTYSPIEILIGTTFTDAELSSGTTYYYKVSAENDCGEGALSSSVSETTISCPKPAVPGSVTAEALSSTSIRITWESASGAASYDIYRSTAAEGTYLKIENTTANTFTNTGLLPATPRYYKIVAINDCGESQMSSYASATTESCPAPAAPTNVSASAKSSTSIEVSWDEVNTAVTYQIYRSASATGTYSPVGSTTGKESTSYTDENLLTGQTFYYKVSAGSDCAESAMSASYAFASTGCENIPTPPTNITAETLSSTEIRVSWDAVSGLGGSNYYNLYACETPNGNYYHIWRISSTFTSGTLTNRSPLTTYYFKISAENNCGESELSTSYATATTDDCDLPIPPNPTGLSASSSSSRSVFITWDNISGATYYVYRSTERYGTYWTVSGGRGLTENSFTDNTVTASTTYYYAVKAINACGGSSDGLGDVVSTTTLCETPVPTNVSATARSSSGIDVSWSAVNNAVSYSVYRASTVSGTYALVGTVASNSFTDTGLSSLTSYFYKITAKTATCDNSNMSEYAVGTTQ